MNPPASITPKDLLPEDLLDAMVRSDVLEIFVLLPEIDQQRFSNWIGKARDNESHWRRINALVLALRLGPLQPPPALVENAAVGVAAGPCKGPMKGSNL